MDQESVISNAESEGRRSSESWQPGLDPEDERALEQAREDGGAIVEEIPTEDDSLGWFSVICLLLNRMIGSGVFNSSFAVFRSTQSVGVTLILWLYGSMTAICGVVLYIEMGLVIPRYLRNGVKISTPRSGGELPYLNYFLKKPRFLATCVFGISFLIFGNTATNSVGFAAAILQASNTKSNAGKLAAIAIAANTFCCLIHSMSRRWGIRLNNIFGTLKLAMLLVMIIFGFVWLDKSVASANLDPNTAFLATTDSPKGVYRYAEAAVFALFPFGGFHQANYVLAEIKNPRKNFARTTGLGVVFICCVFMLLNVLYAAVVPKDILFHVVDGVKGLDASFDYFRLTVGRVTSSDQQTRAIWGSFKAMSAIGNVIVFTFTAARVKQEIAKEGILPGSIYLASSYKFSFRHGFQRLQDGSAGKFLHTEKSPAAALLLHWTVTLVLILAVVFGTTAGGSADFNYVPGYSLLLTAYAFCVDVFYFSLIGIGMLYLRLWPGSNWRYKSPVPHPVGVACAVVFTATNLFPLICIWIPTSTEPFLALSEGIIPWWASQTFVLCVIAASLLYWFGFRLYLDQMKKRRGLVLDIIRQPLFMSDRNTRDLIQAYEIIRLDWTAYDSKSSETDASGVTTTELDGLDEGGHRRDWRTSTVTHTTA